MVSQATRREFLQIRPCPFPTLRRIRDTCMQRRLRPCPPPLRRPARPRRYSLVMRGLDRASSIFEKEDLGEEDGFAGSTRHDGGEFPGPDDSRTLNLQASIKDVDGLTSYGAVTRRRHHDLVRKAV